jgi:hypothetical protein
VPGRRMLICITDGISDTKEESAELLVEAEADGIQAVTVRIGGEPGAHYKHGYSVDHAEELVQLLPRLINQVVRRGS